MQDPHLIQFIDEKIRTIYHSEQLIPLRGKNDSNELNGKPILSWFNEITRHCWCHFPDNFDFNKSIDDLLYTSDEIIYFTAHLYLYRPYINTPIKDAYQAGKNIIYPVFENLAGKRYEMYLGVAFEKVYNYWDRIGDLIASFFPNKFREPIYFIKTIKMLENDYKGNLEYDWLFDFSQNKFKDFNSQRINIVHYYSKNTEYKWEQYGHINDYNKSKELNDKRVSYPEYFNEMNEMSKVGFEKTLKLLEEINKREKYNCEKLRESKK